MSGVRQIGIIKYQLVLYKTLSLQKKQYSIKVYCPTQDAYCSASESVVRLIHGDLGKTYVQFSTFPIPLPKKLS